MFRNRVSFDPSTDIPSLAGKVVLITGGNRGLGKKSALELSRHDPAQLWITARDAEQGKDAVEEIQQLAPPNVAVHFLELDLTSLESVKSAAAKFLASVSRLDILMLNAGLYGGPPGLTKEGYEIRFGTNHLGHALFFKLLKPILLKTSEDPSASAGVRILTFTSDAYVMAPASGIEFEQLRTAGEVPQMFYKYAQSKLAALLFVRELAVQYPQFTAVCVNPGTVKTGNAQTGRGALMRFFAVLAFLMGTSVEEGVKNHLWAATVTAAEVLSGGHYTPVGVLDKGNALANDKELARKLWDWTEKELEGYEL